MAITAVKPNPFNFISLEDAKEWLKIKATDSTLDNVVQRLLNSACSMVEKYIDGPVINRQFAETRDGNASNTIVPEHYPIVSIDDIRIDFNRGFADATKLLPENYVLRGMPSMGAFVNRPSNPYVVIKGLDIVLRDDNNTALLGRIFSGSIVASIQITYTAGWGADSQSIPGDLSQAGMMLLEYLYTNWDQRLTGIRSRSSMQQGFTRDNGANGIPDEICAILDTYKDYGFGNVPNPQHNIFQL